MKKFFSLLTPFQREATALLQIGTFLEYFDLMLYVHMTVFLNDLFFPKTDPFTASLLSGFAFCSTYLLRPLGAIIFGQIGDYFGRKVTIILTSMIMGLSCILMANLPTYNQIGIAAAWGVTICRIIQSLSSQGEIISAQVYLTEISAPPLRYPLVSLTAFFASIGGMSAIGLTVLLSMFSINWRLAFWVGAAISSIGLTARVYLQESPEFLKEKRYKAALKNKLQKINKNRIRPLEEIKSKDNSFHLTNLAYFLISCGYPLCFYFSYIYCNHILKTEYGYSAESILKQNFILSIVQCLNFFIFSLISYYINPLKLLKFRLCAFLPFIIIYPFLVSYFKSPLLFSFLQIYVMALGIMSVPATGLIMPHFPVLKRLTNAGLIYSISRLTIYMMTTFGMIYVIALLGDWGITLIMGTLSLGFTWSIKHFEKLERKIVNPLEIFLPEPPRTVLLKRNF